MKAFQDLKLVVVILSIILLPFPYGESVDNNIVEVKAGKQIDLN